MTTPPLPPKKQDPESIEEVPAITIKNRPSIDKLAQMLQERPYVANLIQFQLLYDMASILEDLLDLTKSTIPEGKTIPREYTVTNKPTEIDRKMESSLPWRSMDLVNYGPNKLYVTINESRVVEKAPLAMGESMRIDFRAPKIERIVLLSTGSSVVRMMGTR